MIKLTQTKLSNEEGTVHGNCLRTCIACILEIDPDEIPTLEDMGEKWFEAFYYFLQERGYEFDGTLYLNKNNEYGKDAAEAELERFKKYIGVDGYIIVGGKSPRTYVTRGHAVVYKNGEFFWDPHPSRAGLLEIEDALMIRRKNNI